MKIQSKGIANKSAKGEMLDVFFSYIEFEDKRIAPIQHKLIFQ